MPLIHFSRSADSLRLRQCSGHTDRLLTAAFYLLLIAGHLGFFDVVYFHHYRCQLHRRPECQREVLWHTARHFIYACQFIFIANLRLHGLAMLALVVLYVADIFVAWSDVWEETRSRSVQGGLPRGEYLMHTVLSVLVGGYLMCVAQATWGDWAAPTAVIIDPPQVPWPLRALMTFMGLSALVLFVHDLQRWRRFRKQVT